MFIAPHHTSYRNLAVGGEHFLYPYIVFFFVRFPYSVGCYCSLYDCAPANMHSPCKISAFKTPAKRIPNLAVENTAKMKAKILADIASIFAFFVVFIQEVAISSFFLPSF